MRAIRSIVFVIGVSAALSVRAQTTADETPPARLPDVEVVGHYDNAVGTSDAASQGAVTSKLIEGRPILRPAEVLEFVPGVIVTQHSGDGKANQYFLRGFNLDHGTDFATFVDGMPVNMPTHAHGQGYSDLNWLIPELVNRIDYRKGPYFADEGDFSSAGAAHIGLFDNLPRGIATLTLGEHAYQRALIANSVAVGPGSLLFAGEAAHNDGPWDLPERFHRTNGVLRYSLGTDTSHTSITAMAYDAGWDSTDQIPLRAVRSGLIDRFGAIDPSDGGQTSRASLSVEHETQYDDGTFKANAYAIRSRLDLFSDFTYNLDAAAPLNADQFEQAEQRRVLGGALSRSIDGTLFDAATVNTIGLQVRNDHLTPVGLYGTVDRVRVSTTQVADVGETAGGVYGETATHWLPWLRSVAGLRYDVLHVDVDSSIAANSGKQTSGLASPKLSLIFGPWQRTEFFVNYGDGYHSNDARGITTTVTPKEGTPTDGSPALVRSRGGELGMRSEFVPGLQTSLALWQLKLGSELVFSGDAGDTEASGASRRSGIELNNHYTAARWLLFDGDISVSRARFDQPQGDAPDLGRYIPGSVKGVVSLGASVVDLGPWFGHVQVRYFGPRPLIEDDSETSRPTTLAYLRVGYRFTPQLRLALDVFNLFDRKASDIDYFYASRLPGEPAGGVDDVHFHPVEPRSARLTLTVNF